MKTIIIPQNRMHIEPSVLEIKKIDKEAFLQSKKDIYEELGFNLEDSFENELFI